MTDFLRRFENNTLGRDFVVGDLHGCIDAFEIMLSKIDFDITRDRMFSVGDLIDRGEDSLACLRLLREPWFHAVRGNHEDMMLEAIGDNSKGGVENWIYNGGDWGIECFEEDDPEFFELVGLVEELPLAITVQTPSLGVIGISHAEPPTEWSEPCVEAEAQKLLWSRKKIDAPGSNLKQVGVDFSVHGHTVTSSITVRDEINAFWIDLGCYVTQRLCSLQITDDDLTWPTEHIVAH
jgi:serine/threonine protein phosphatase 1